MSIRRKAQVGNSYPLWIFARDSHLHDVASDMCQFGLTTKGRRGKECQAKKLTEWATLLSQDFRKTLLL